MRSINYKILHVKLSRFGEGDDALIVVRGKTGLSLSFLQKIANGKYTSTPTKSTRMSLAAALDVSEDELFPVTRKSA